MTIDLRSPLLWIFRSPTRGEYIDVQFLLKYYAIVVLLNKCVTVTEVLWAVRCCACFMQLVFFLFRDPQWIIVKFKSLITNITLKEQINTFIEESSCDYVINVSISNVYTWWQAHRDDRPAPLINRYGQGPVTGQFTNYLGISRCALLHQAKFGIL